MTQATAGTSPEGRRRDELSRFLERTRPGPPEDDETRAALLTPNPRRPAVTYGEQEIEQAIEARGAGAPRLTPADIDRAIAAERYYVFPGTTVTVCCLTLVNGFSVTGMSAAVSPSNFDAHTGRAAARGKAREQIWQLEAYRLRQRLFEAGQ